MKVLIIIPSIENISGVDYHRLLIPHKQMEREYKDIEYYTADDLTIVPMDILKSMDIIVVNRMLSKKGLMRESIEIFKQLDAKLIVDMDDDYILPSWHIMYEDAKLTNHTKNILDTLQLAHLVTCTHSVLANTLKQVYKGKIEIVPNGIMPEGQFEYVKEPTSNRLIFGWSGSITHFEDVMELYPSLVSLYRDTELGLKFKMVYGGYKAGDIPSTAIGNVLSDKGNANPLQFSYYEAKTPREYARFYDGINVSLIPLRLNRFNANKSNLKMLETGFKKRACIVSPVEPYTTLINPGKNCLTAKNKHDWFRQITKLINNPELRFDLADSLYEDVQQYHIKHIAKKRHQIYKSLC